MRLAFPMVLVFGAAMAAAIPAFSDHDIDIHVNGDFRGSPSGAQVVPGWTLSADGGSARLLPARKPGKALLELRATPYRGQSAVSDLHTIRGNVLKLEVKISGSGTVAVGYEVFDAARRQIAGGEMVRAGLGAVEAEFKHYFTLNAPGAAYIRLRLTAEPNSTAVFRDVDADWKNMPVPAPAPAPTPAPAPAVAPAPAPVPAGGAFGQPLVHEKYYSFRSLAAVERFQVSLPVGSDIEFDLGEDASRGQYWSVASYDPSMCRIKLEHDQEGIFPFRRDQAEFELKALRPGTSMIELVCGGKKVQIRFTAL